MPASYPARRESLYCVDPRRGTRPRRFAARHPDRLLSYLLLIVGLTVLVIAGDILVRGAVALARRLGIAPVIIGLTVVAFGTSAPELMISVRAALADSPGIALGNVIGSNVANVLLVLGLPAIIAATSCHQPLVLRNMLAMIAASALFAAMCLTGTLEAWHGLVLVGLLVLYLGASVRRAMKQRLAATADVPEVPKGLDRSAPAALGLTGLGFGGLALGAELTVGSAREIAAAWGVSEGAIGLTIVAVGTSLPELATTLMAALRREGGIALGNVIGSNLFNILAVMGVTALVVPVPVPDAMLRFDLWVMLACAVALLPYILARAPIGRSSGIVFTVLYAAYVTTVMAERAPFG